MEIPALVRLLGVPPGGHVLELGCGRGVAFAALAEKLTPASLTGIDLDRGDLEAARDLGVVNSVVVADATSLPFAEGSFDTVVDFGTTHHLADPVAGLREVARVLTPGGWFVHETALAQALAHPLRYRGGRLPWESVPTLAVERRAGLWTARRRR